VKRETRGVKGEKIAKTAEIAKEIEDKES